MKKVLVTGGAGYIGSVLVRLLLNRNYKVRVVDSLKFGGESLLEQMFNPNFELINGDIRNEDILKKSLKDIDYVAHLAAIVGDPACKKFASEANETMDFASKKLYELSNQFSIKKFVFASTCSNYGKMSDPNSYVNEESGLNPISHYADLKVKFEKYLMASDSTPYIILRFSTVYGFSPRMRFDLTVNEFTRNFLLEKKQEIWGPSFNRPYCHVDDLALSVINSIESKNTLSLNNVFNVGDTTENYTKKMLMDELLRRIPDGIVDYVEKDEDPRDYRVNCDKIKKILGFNITKRVPDGIEEIIKIISSSILSDPYSSKYRNV